MTDETQTLFSFAQQLGVIPPLHAMVGADAPQPAQALRVELAPTNLVLWSAAEVAK